MTLHPEPQCALCGATWGDYWEEIEGRRRFFCCDVCAKQYRAILAEARTRTGWDSIDGLAIRGDYRGRLCVASRGTQVFQFVMTFFEDGTPRTFVEV